jgi:SAM-dependent methyltransferase
MSIARVWRAAWNRVRWCGHQLAPRGARCGSYSEFRQTEFDRRYGVETAATVGLAELGDGLANRDQANHYGAIDAGDFRALVRRARIDPRQFTFVDLGSGKGRALILAAELGFRAVVGVEFSPVLHEVALANLEVYRRRAGSKSAIRAVCQDATQYEFPSGPLAVFFYNSFRGPVLEQVLANLAKAAASAQSPIYLLWPGVHWFADIRAILEASPHLTCLVERDDARVYRVGAAVSSDSD